MIRVQCGVCSVQCYGCRVQRTVLRVHSAAYSVQFAVCRVCSDVYSVQHNCCCVIDQDTVWTDPAVHTHLASAKQYLVHTEGRVVSIWYTLSSAPHVFWILSFVCWISCYYQIQRISMHYTFFMHYIIPPLKKIFDQKNTKKYCIRKTVVYEIQMPKCTKTPYQTDTIRPVVYLGVTLHTQVQTAYGTQSCKNLCFCQSKIFKIKIG